MAIATFVAVGAERRRRRRSRCCSRASTPYDAVATRRRRRSSSRRAPARGRSTSTIALSGMTALVGGGDLDAHAVAALRRDGLHVLADPRGVPVRPRHRQQHRLGDRRAASRARASRSAGARCCCAARSRGRRTCCTQSLPYWPINPSIATEPLVQLPARSRPRLWAVLPGAILWGASFPLALAVGRHARAGSGAAGRRRLRREHGRRDRRLAGRRACCWSSWLGSQHSAAGADHHLGALRRC